MDKDFLETNKLKRVSVGARPDRPHSRNVMPGGHPGAVGPFIFLDHLGPFHFPAGREVYIPPHPHAGIATISYMFEGEGHHVDSLGNNQVLHARRVNYMNAGNGILHSEGLSEAFTKKGGKLCGVQIWHLLSEAERNSSPRFQTLGERELIKVSLGTHFSSVVLMGEYQNHHSVINTDQSLVLMTIENDIQGAAFIELRSDWEYLLYVCDGNLQADNQTLAVGEGLVLAQSTQLHLSADTMCRAILLGGSPLKEQPLFNGSLVSVGVEQMAEYISRMREGKMGTMPENKPVV
jgi:redox-sensitive bicupin YhaK (pirin superfamily)